MSALPEIFTYEGRQVRTVTVHGEPWFVAVDVCAVLDIAQAVRAVQGLDEDEVNSTHVIDSMGREQQTYIVNEPGLYSLILRSRKPEAREFKRWVTHQVLPQIRLTGSYTPQPTMPTHSEALRGWADEIDHRQKVEARNAELEPKAEQADTYLATDGLELVGTVAKKFGMKERDLRDFLHRRGILIRADGHRHNEPYAQYRERGYFEVKSRPIDTGNGSISRNTTYVTPKGVDFIFRQLRDHPEALPSGVDRQLVLIQGGVA